MLPQKWSRPVVDSVILPSHASTTEGTTGNYYYNDNLLVQNKSGSGSRLFAERILDAVVPTAQAAQLPFTTYICIAITGNTYTARVIRSIYNDQQLADYDDLVGTVGVEKALPAFDTPCDKISNSATTMLVNTVTPGSCYCEITAFNTTERIEVPKGNCANPNFVCDD